MASVSLQRWLSDRATSLDEIEEAHRGIGGTGPGRRYATQQINQAYAVLLSAQFQGFCRDLHSEASRYLMRSIQPVAAQRIVDELLTVNRKLAHGNPNPGNLGSDCNRLGLDFWAEVKKRSVNAEERKRQLEELVEWRNTIAHQDFRTRRVLGRTLHLSDVRRWRSSCKGLARDFDAVLRDHLTTLTGVKPW
jgi:hypothetical protein